MNDLIEALNIFKKYVKEDSYEFKRLFHCEHDQLMVYIVNDPEIISEEDRSRLSELGFDWSDEGHFLSYRFGSC